MGALLWAFITYELFAAGAVIGMAIFELGYYLENGSTYYQWFTDRRPSSPVITVPSPVTPRQALKCLFAGAVGAALLIAAIVD